MTGLLQAIQAAISQGSKMVTIKRGCDLILEDEL